MQVKERLKLGILAIALMIGCTDEPLSLLEQEVVVPPTSLDENQLNTTQEDSGCSENQIQTIPCGPFGNGLMMQNCVNQVWVDTEFCQDDAIKGRYVILTSQKIRAQSNEIESFIEHKKKRGFKVSIFDESDFDIKDALIQKKAENIRSFLIKEHQKDPMMYLLILGDPRTDKGKTPMKMLYPKNKGALGYSPSGTEISCKFSPERVPSDYYYSLLKGNWNRDDDVHQHEHNGNCGAEVDDV